MYSEQSAFFSINIKEKCCFSYYTDEHFPHFSYQPLMNKEERCVIVWFDLSCHVQKDFCSINTLYTKFLLLANKTMLVNLKWNISFKTNQYIMPIKRKLTKLILLIFYLIFTFITIIIARKDTCILLFILQICKICNCLKYDNKHFRLHLTNLLLHHPFKFFNPFLANDETSMYDCWCQPIYGMRNIS